MELRDYLTYSHGGVAKDDKADKEPRGEACPLSNLSELSTSATLDDLSPTEREFYEERAGILEFDAGLPRKKAEADAMNLTMEMRASRLKPVELK